MGCGTKSLPKRWKCAKKVEIPTAAVWKSLPKQRKSVEKVEIPYAAVRISLPKQQKSAERVENPTAAVRKSLPKQRKSAEKVENPGAPSASSPARRPRPPCLPARCPVRLVSRPGAPHKTFPKVQKIRNITGTSGQAISNTCRGVFLWKNIVTILKKM